MRKQLTLKLLPSEAASAGHLKIHAANAMNVSPDAILGIKIIRRSIDARSKQPMVVLTIDTFIDEPFFETPIEKLILRDVSQSTHQVIIIGAGPAGLFAALKFLENGVRPLILERGKDVRSRRRDLAELNKTGVINPESNYCFGEGGAGTYSDGKLYTRSTKRGDINRILQAFVQFGADEKILYETHPHIGTNKLPHIITSMRNAIISCGGQIHFDERAVDLALRRNMITEVKTATGKSFTGEAVVLATGHSARDIFHLLLKKNIAIEAKPFALGVRVEHPQSLIDSIQYHRATRDEFLPPASYNLVQQVDDRGVFSFCMCPGGIIAPAATAPGELVVNGWSPSKRNNPFANSGMVVAVSDNDIHQHLKKMGGYTQVKDQKELHGMFFQQDVERKAYEAGGGKFVAPAQRITDFIQGKISSTLPECSYVPGVRAAEMKTILPPFVYSALQKAFLQFDKKMKGYLTREAIVVATESRTSSPVRIPRDSLLQHPVIKNLYPCGEGAGYAGGIVSAAMDGERVAAAIVEHLLR